MTRTTKTRTHARSWYALLASAASLAAAACSDSTSTSPLERSANAALSASLATLPAGYGNLTSSYVDSAARDSAVWCGGGREARFAGGSLMGGGLGDAFIGGIGGGRFGNHGPFGGGLGCADATFSSATGRVSCPTVTRGGLTLTRSAAYTDAAGQTQQAFDSLTTNTVNLQTSVTGTRSFATGSDSGSHRGPGGDGHDGRHGWGEGRGPGGRLLGDTATILTATTTVQSFSNRTVSGLAQGSTQRTVTGTSSGNESTTGTSSRGDFTATRTVADTTQGLVVPVQTSGSTYPTAGTVIRVMTATLTYSGQSTASVSRREVVTYNGSATAQVVVTENGVTKNCTRPLPRGPLTCQ